MKQASILIAEDDFIIREGLLKSLLEPYFAIVASVEDGQAAVAAATECKPEIALIDISLPGLRGFEVARQILAANPECKVLLVSGYTEPSYPQTLRDLGGSGYVLKTRIQNELLPAIEMALAGGFYQSLF